MGGRGAGCDVVRGRTPPRWPRARSIGCALAHRHRACGRWCAKAHPMVSRTHEARTCRASWRFTSWRGSPDADLVLAAAHHRIAFLAAERGAERIHVRRRADRTERARRVRIGLQAHLVLVFGV